MINDYLSTFVGYVWSYPVVGLCLFSGIFFTLRMVFIQIRCFPHAIALVSGKYDNPNEKGEITHFQALCAALSGTIGLGNIAGVSIAIALGGPGAVLWMWILGFLGMATKFAECTLGTHFREEDPDKGEVHGGPMYYITKGLGKKWFPLAAFYAVAVALAAFGVGSMFQSNQAASALYESYNVPHWLTGLILFTLGAIVTIGGIKRIGKVASRIVPVMCVIYVLGALLICLLNIDKLGSVILIIIQDAFSGKAAAGGVVWLVVKMGVRRAIFSNEAGLGSASIAHAAVKTDYPVREGFVASLGPFIDTIIVCTATAMVIILSGHYGTERYQDIHQPISFEQSTPINNTKNWSIEGQSIPQQKQSLRAFIHGKQTLKLESDGKKIDNIILPPIQTTFSKSNNSNTSVIDGIRFSYFKEKGDIQLAIFDKQNTLLDAYSLSTGQSLNNNKSPLITLSHKIFDKEWNGSILLLSEALKEKIKANPKQLDTLTIVLQNTTEDSLWYIDRINPVRSLQGIELTTLSFDKFFKGFGSIFITFAVFFFAFSTIITWSYYGETAASYVFGKKIILPYKWLFVFLAFIGSLVKLEAILNLGDALLGLVVIPNTIAIILLSPTIVKLTKEYFLKLQTGDIKPYKKQ